MPAVSIEHYENFPVASLLCPPALRPAVVAIYHFARTADDLADEGNATVPERQAALQAYRADLLAVEAGHAPSPTWAERVFGPLAGVLREYRLPAAQLHALLDAFEQDLCKSDYAEPAELLRYCQKSANPIGRLLLHLYGITDAQALARSDAICSALQLINFWQDLSRDGPRGRVYAPDSELRRFGVSRTELLECRDSLAARALIASLVDWAQALLQEGAPLVHQVPGRAGWELRLVVQGGRRILAKIRAMQFDTLRRRPALTPLDWPPILWAALCMRPGTGARP